MGNKLNAKKNLDPIFFVPLGVLGITKGAYLATVPRDYHEVSRVDPASYFHVQITNGTKYKLPRSDWFPAFGISVRFLQVQLL